MNANICKSPPPPSPPPSPPPQRRPPHLTTSGTSTSHSQHLSMALAMRDDLPHPTSPCMMSGTHESLFRYLEEHDKHDKGKQWSLEGGASVFVVIKGVVCLCVCFDWYRGDGWHTTTTTKVKKEWRFEGVTALLSAIKSFVLYVSN